MKLKPSLVIVITMLRGRLTLVLCTRG